MASIVRVPVILLFCSLVPIASVCRAAPARSDVTGRITSADGRPLGGADVYVWTAGPKVGTSPYCPSCYADCGKHARSSAADGAFTVPQLDSELEFRFLVVCRGFSPRFVENVDPAGAPLAVVLNPAPPAPEDPRCTLTGTVVGPDAKPVARATVVPFGMKTPDGVVQHGLMERFMDPLAVTDDDGQFRIVSRQPVDSLDLRVEARGLVTLTPTKVPTGRAPQRLQMANGASVTVRLLKDGKPLAGAEVGLVQSAGYSEDGGDVFAGAFTLGTDKAGRATFANVPTGRTYAVYGKMQSLSGRGAAPLRTVTVGRPDSAAYDAGDLAVVPGRTLSGRVVLSDGKPMPPKTRLLVSRQIAMDAQSVELDDQGRFTIGDLPDEAYAVQVRVRGYHSSPRNASIDPVNGGSLRGDIHQDVRNLLIVLDPGVWQQPNWDDVRDGRIGQPTGPLRGAESAESEAR